MAAKRKVGDRWQEGDLIFTVNPANDKKLRLDPGAYYVSIQDVKTGEHSTAVYNSDGTFAPVKANRDWQKAGRQGQSAAQVLVESFRRAMRYWFR